MKATGLEASGRGLGVGCLKLALISSTKISFKMYHSGRNFAYNSIKKKAIITPDCLPIISLSLHNTSNNNNNNSMRYTITIMEITQCFFCYLLRINYSRIPVGVLAPCSYLSHYLYYVPRRSVTCVRLMKT